MVRKGNLVVFEGSSISETGETTPTKIGVYIYIYIIYVYNIYIYIYIYTCIYIPILV